MNNENLLTEKDKTSIKHITIFLDKIMDCIYTKDKKTYLYYAKKLNEMDFEYSEFIINMYFLAMKIKKMASNVTRMPLVYGISSLAFSLSSLVNPVFLLGSIICIFKYAKTNDINIYPEIEYIADALEEINKRNELYEEQIKNIMKSYIEYDETKGYVDCEENMNEEELYKIANCFIAFLIYQKESVDLKCVRKEVIDKMVELMQMDMNTNENDLLVLLDMVDDYIIGHSKGYTKTLN